MKTAKIIITIGFYLTLFYVSFYVYPMAKFIYGENMAYLFAYFPSVGMLFFYKRAFQASEILLGFFIKIDPDYKQ